jgi:FKBP-type peptidyl-prolyl cis-trans isomerase
MSIRSAVAILLAASLTAGTMSLTPAFAQDGQPGSAPPAPATPPAGAPPAMPELPPAPPTPTPLPVPEGPAVKTTELGDGLIAEDIKLGEGYEIKPGGVVVAHYHGTLKDGGKVFDSSYQRAEPIAIPLANVIQGWQKGVPGMKLGGIRRLIIPAALAYGDAGQGPDIPPNSDLVFIIEALDTIQIEDTTPGDGEAATNRCVVVVQHVVKGMDGKEITKTEASKPYIWLPGELPGMQFGLEGIKVGGKRTIKIPKEFNPMIPGLETDIPRDVPLIIEVEAIAIRNLPGR